MVRFPHAHLLHGPASGVASHAITSSPRRAPGVVDGGDVVFNVGCGICRSDRLAGSSAFVFGPRECGSFFALLVLVGISSLPPLVSVRGGADFAGLFFARKRS